MKTKILTIGASTAHMVENYASTLEEICEAILQETADLYPKMEGTITAVVVTIRHKGKSGFVINVSRPQPGSVRIAKEHEVMQ